MGDAGRTALREDFHLKVPVELEAQNAFLLNDAKRAFDSSSEGGSWRGYFDRAAFPDSAAITFHFPRADDGRAFLTSLLEAEAIRAGNIRPVGIVYRTDEDFKSVFGGPSARTLYERFSVDSMPVVFEWLAASDRLARGTLSLACDVLIAQMLIGPKVVASLTGDAVSDAYPAGFLSYRSHAEGFFILSRDPDASRAVMSRRYTSIESTVCERLRQIGDCAERGELPRHLAAWAALAERTMSTVHAELGKGRLAPSSSDALSVAKDLEKSAFHHRLYKSRNFRRFALSDYGFSVNRVMLGLMYLTLFRLGLPLIERYFLCYAISRAVEETYHITAAEAIQRSLARLRRKYRRPYELWKWLP